MGKTYQAIDETLSHWIGEQKMFFVATAPLDAGGHVNCSPKGGDSFRVLGQREVAYQDLTGSGVETIAHLRENRRIVIMFCAFEGPPMILRIYGQGEVVAPCDPDFTALSAHFPEHVGTRAFIRVKVDRIADSCGYAVPQYEFKADRRVLDKWSDGKGPEKLAEYRETRNRESIDGLPGF